MATTTRFGLEKVSPSLGGSIADKDSKYTSTDRDVIDRVLAAFENHDHSGGSNPVALASPVAAATAAINNTGGQIGNGSTRFYKYALVDQFGLETAGSPEVAVVLPAVVDIIDGPDAVGSEVDGSALPLGTYFYALTGNTLDGETTLGPETVVSIVDTDNQADLSLPALPDEVISWNVWRQNVTEDGWTKVFEEQAGGVTVHDVGYASGDCLCDPNTQPPLIFGGTEGTKSITVTPASIAGAVSWRLYVTENSGNYSSASLVATIVKPSDVTPLPTSYIDIGAATLSGQPLTTSTTLKPTKTVAGGGGGSGGGGGADSHLMTALQYQDTTGITSGDDVPLYIDSASWDRVGQDITLVHQVDGSDGDELQIGTDGVYTLLARLSVSAAAGSVFQVSPVWGVRPLGTGFTDALPQTLGQLIVPPGVTDAEGGFSLGPVYLPAGTRVGFKATPYFTGSAPTILAGIGAAMASGTPVTEAAVAPVDFTVTDAGTGGTLHVTWTPDSDVDDYTFLVYRDNKYVAGYFGQTLGSADLGGFTDGLAYTVFGLARKDFDAGYELYSLANIESGIPTTVAPAAGPISQDFSGVADGTVLGPPDWTQGAAPGSLQTLGGKVINQGGMFGPRFAVHDFGAADKAVSLVHNAIATKTLVVWLAAPDAEGGNPGVSLAIKGDGTAPGMTYNDGVGSGNVNTTLAAAGGSTWAAYDGGSSGPMVCQIVGTDVGIYNTDGLCWSGTIPAPIASTMAGFGLFASGGSIDGITISEPVF